MAGQLRVRPVDLRVIQVRLVDTGAQVVRHDPGRYPAKFAADRYHQLDTEIRPHRAAGRIVLCDRYLASGLVVQRADGLDLAFLAGINAHADPPDLAVILTADPDTIAERLAARGVHNRYQGSPALAAAEIAHYREAATHLEHLDASVLCIDTSHTAPDRVAVRIAAAITDRLRNAPATAGKAAR